MQRNATSAPGLRPVESNQPLWLSQDAVQCPNCRRMCYFSEFAFQGERTAHSRCLHSTGGCGCNFEFDQEDGRLVTLKMSPEPIGLDGFPVGPQINVRAMIEKIADGPLEARIAPDGSSVAETQNRPAESILEPHRGSAACLPSAEGVPGGTPGEAEDGDRELSFLDNGVKIVEIIVSTLKQKTYVEELGDSETAKRLSNFDRRKRIGKRIAERLLERGDIQLANKLSQCSSCVTLRRFLETGKVEVRESNWCQKRMICANCEKARASRNIGQTVPKVVEALTAGDYVPWMVTLTVRDGLSLHERMKHMFEGLRKAGQRRRDYIAGRCKTVGAFGHIAGAMWHAEIKRGKNSGLWHPHLHGICLVPRNEELNTSEISAAWKLMTRDSHICDARRTNFGNAMYSLDASADVLFASDRGREMLLKDLCEILKYCLKFDADQSPDDVIDAYYSMSGKHLSRTWGELRSLRAVDFIKVIQDSSEYGRYLDYVMAWSDSEDGYQVVNEVAGTSIDPNMGRCAA